MATAPFGSEKLKGTLALGDTPLQIETVVTNASVNNNTDDPDRYPTLDGVQHFEETEDAWTLSFTANHEWSASGISQWLVDHDGDLEDFELVLNPGVTGKEVAYTGVVRIKAPNVGGEANARHTFELELPVQGKPVVTRAA